MVVECSSFRPTISQPDTSHTTITACDSYEWNGETYSESGTYEHLVIEADNNYSMSFGVIVMTLKIMLKFLLVLPFPYNQNLLLMLG